jgi:hypothetical protein
MISSLVGWAWLLSGAEALPTIYVLDDFDVINNFTVLLVIFEEQYHLVVVVIEEIVVKLLFRRSETAAEYSHLR